MPEGVVCVGEPGELIAGIPAMIGFSPQRSLVVLLLRAVPDRHESVLIDAVMRLDLDQDGGRSRLRAKTVVSCITQLSAHNDVAGVLAVIIDDRVTESTVQPDDAVDPCRTGRFAGLVAAVDRLLAVEDIPLAGAWAVPAIEPEQCWQSLLGGQQRGVLPDPAASALALSHVLDGRPVLGSRAELTALVAEDVELQQDVAALLDSAATVARDRYARAARRGDPDAYTRQALEYVLWQVGNAGSGSQLMAPELAEIAVALRDRAVRDIMFAVAVGEHAAAAADLFSVLASALSGRDRAEAAALLGYCAYTRGDGPLAGVALEAALTADPDHSLALLLHDSLAVGIRPEQMRRLARSAFQAAADLGVDLAGT
ncbi:DUF4192 domain-containing protein [Nocardia sp. CA-128927]|uniref:DUF4192 domain-containing protein n=1 Tax=Nocardia sp. CA-128927 TaxID=3239975 RepID=UPI003D9622DC